VEGDQLIERAAQNFVAPVRRDRRAGHRFDPPDGVVEFPLVDRFAVHAGKHRWNLRGHRLGRCVRPRRNWSSEWRRLLAAD